MTCHDIDDLMSSGGGKRKQAPEGVEHLARCGECRRLMHLMDEDGEETLAPAESQLRRIRDRITENLKSVRPMPSSNILLMVCAIIFLCVVGVGARILGTNGMDAMSVAQRIAVLATLVASAVWLAISMVGQMAPGSGYALAPAALVIAILTVLMLVIAVTFHAQQETAFVANGLICVRNGLTYSVPGSILFWLLAA